jgi:hypothetical protein
MVDASLIMRDIVEKMGCPRQCLSCDATYGIKEFLVWIDYNKLLFH